MNAPFQKAYKNCLKARKIELVWPTTKTRAESIYETIQFAIKRPNQNQKELLLEKLVEAARNFHENKNSIMANESSFDKWFFEAVKKLRNIKFEWSQKRKQNSTQEKHEHATFGVAQKLLNLVLKDWWAFQGDSIKTTESNFLHGPIDGVIQKAIYRFTLDKKFKIDSVYYQLAPENYPLFQEELKRLGLNLQKSFDLSFAPNRIQTEQLIWGWIN
jgi:hypothetical protein